MLTSALSSQIDKSWHQQASQQDATRTVIYWFRNDLRIENTPAPMQACQTAQNVMFVYCHASGNGAFNARQ
ncbi:deoxyribodipyrimidine photo-lyase [Undibacterium sp. SXout11W]|uniref:deoxyribodipyrimidine photo-lyase n=1 Tax=Undibacterium sp. SXout11W TaxID=3413050 RepID=UPI003BF0E77B